MLDDPSDLKPPVQLIPPVFKSKSLTSTKRIDPTALLPHEALGQPFRHYDTQKDGYDDNYDKRQIFFQNGSQFKGS